MNLTFIAFVLLQFLAAGITLFMVQQLWSRRATSGALAAVVMLLSMAIWEIAYALELLSSGLPAKMFWVRVEFLGILLLPTAWLVLVLRYTGNERFLSPLNKTIMAVRVILMYLLVWTNNWHAWFWSDAQLAGIPPFTFIQHTFSPFFWLNMTIDYLLVLISLVLLLRSLLASSPGLRLQFILLFLAPLPPLLASVGYLAQIDILRGLDFTPMTFAFTALFLVMGFFRFSLFTLLPLARSAVFDQMADAVLVLDDRFRLIDFNRSATTLFPGLSQANLGRQVEQDFPDWPPLMEMAIEKVEDEIRLNTQVGERFLIRRVSVIHRPREVPANQPRAYLVLLSDITPQKQAEASLLQNQAVLRRQVKDLQVITEIGRQLSTILNHQQVLDTITRLALEHTQADFSLLVSVQPNQQLQIICAQGLDAGLVRNLNTMRLRADDTPLTLALLQPQPQMLENIHLDHNSMFAGVIQTHDIRHAIFLPLLHGHEVIGDLVVGRFGDARLTRDELLFLEALAQQAVNALQNTRLFQAERRARTTAEALRTTGQVLSASLDTNQVLDQLLDQVAHLVPYDSASVMQVDGRRSRFIRWRGFDQYGPEIESQVSNWVVDLDSMPLLQRLIKAGTPLAIADIHQEPDWLPGSASEYFHSWIGVPITYLDEDLLLFNLDKREVDFYQPEHLEWLALFAGQARLALQNAHLYEETRRRASQMEALNTVIAAAVGANDLNALMETALKQLMVALNISAGGVRFRNQFIGGNLDRRIVRLFSKTAMLAGMNPSQAIYVENWHEQSIAVGPFQAQARIMLGEGVLASAAAPIVSGGRLVGGIGLASRKPRKWSADDRALLEAVCSQISAAADRLGLLDETHRRLAQVTLLSQVISATAASMDRQTALTEVCFLLSAYYESHHCSFWMFDAATQEALLVTQATPDRLGTALESGAQASDQLVTRLSLSSLGVIDHPSDELVPWILPAPEVTPAPELHTWMDTVGISNILLIPVQVVGQLAAALLLEVSPGSALADGLIFTERHLLQDISSQLGQWMERLQLFQAADRHASQMAHLARLSGELNRPYTFSEVVQGIGHGALILGSTSRAALYLRLSEQQIDCPWYYGLSDSYIRQVINQVRSLPGVKQFESIEPVLIEDTDMLPEKAFLRVLAQQEGFRSVGLWPLVYQERTIASLACYYPAPHTYTLEHREVMLTFTRQAAVAIQNARLFDETRRRAVQQEALNAIITAAVTAPDLPYLLENVIDLAMHALRVNRGGIWAHGLRVLRNLPQEIGAMSRSNAVTSETHFTASFQVADWDDVQEEHLQPYRASMLAMGVRATLSVPISAAGVRIGGLALASEEARPWQADDVALSETIGRQLGGAIERLSLLEKTGQQARQMQQIIETVPEGVLLLDHHFVILMANPAAAHNLQHLAGGAVPGQAVDTLGGWMVREVLDACQAQPWVELESETVPAHIYEVAARSLDAGDQRQGWVLVSREVTQEREYQARIQMQERLATVGQLAAGIAHDFNNIMAAIVIYTDLLELEPGLSLSGRERLGVIAQQIQRATSLIRQILDFSRRSVMEQVQLDLFVFLKEMEHLLQRVLPENIQLQLLTQPAEYMVLADPTRLQQVFMNLALNARDAMPLGGKLYFELSRLTLAEDDPSLVPEMRPGQWIRVSVEDQGKGIPADVLPHVFDPFFTTKPVGQGTGLGLAQVYGIVQQHGGNIDVQSRENLGTIFTIYLPALTGAVQVSHALQEETPLDGMGALVLVVEDDQVARLALQDTLQTLHFKVISAVHGRQALELYDQQAAAIRLVICDVIMPEMDGLQFYKELRQRDPQARVLFLTGHPLDENRRTFLELGQVHWLQKPYTLPNLIAALRGLIAE